MSKAARYLPPEDTRKVSARSDLKGAWLVIHAWGTIFASMALFAAFPGVLTFVLAILLIGGRQLGLAILMHDGSHGVLFKTPKLNAIIVQWLCAYPIFSEMWAYRKYHLVHHKFTQQDNDPDLPLSAPFPITKRSFRRKVIRDLTGQTCFKQRRAQFRAGLGDPSLPTQQRLTLFYDRYKGPLFINLGLFVLLALVGKWYYYFAFWILPFMTWQQLILRVRNIAEHAMVPAKDDIFLNARTTKANWIIRAILAPYWVNYHVEHHMMIYVPCYNLPLAHELLRRRGWHDKMEIQPDYAEVLKIATSKPDDGSRTGHDRAAGEQTSQMFAGINGPIVDASQG